MSITGKLKIGITGGIGSGKSVVCRIFSCLGIPIYNADDRAKELTVGDGELRNAIVQLLGPESYTTDGAYNRSYVAEKVFGNPGLLHQLNGLIHPRVQHDTQVWMKQLESSPGIPYVVKEAAIMNRAGKHNDLDRVVVVTASEELRLRRIRQRDPHRSEEQIRDIIKRQISEEERRSLADYVITNDDNSSLIDQVLRLHQTFLNIRKNS